MDRRQEIRDKLAKMEPAEREQAITAMVRRTNLRNRLIEAVKGLPSPEKAPNQISSTMSSSTNS